MRNNFDGKVIIITGSSMGIGKALAFYLGKHKGKLVINGRDSAKLLSTEMELKNLGHDVISFNGDITNEVDCKNLIEISLQHYGRIDVLINNAGVSMRGTLEQLSPDVISKIFKVNTIGPVMLTQMALPHIRQSKGSIVFISSLAGLQGLPAINIYSAAKMALTAIAEALWIETKLDPIHIGIVYVGITEIEPGKTAIGADGSLIPLNERKDFSTHTTGEVAKKIAEHITYRKKKTYIGTIAKLYAFLARYFPGVLGFLVSKSYRKMDKRFQ